MLVVYYSRTGNTRRLAERIAAEAGAVLAPIHCPRYAGGGPFVYMRAAIDAMMGTRVPVSQPVPAEGHEAVVLACPVWVGRPAPPLLSWLAGQAGLPARVGLALTSGAGGQQPVAFAKLRAALAGPEVARLSLSEKEVAAGAGEDRIAAFLAAFGKA